MSDSSGSSAILGVIIGVLIVAAVIFFWANGTFNGSKSVNVAVQPPAINITPPAVPSPAK
jgi:hypothetical protein